MGITARTGDTRLRGDLLGALARPASLRLVGVTPFGAPSFVLVAEPTAAVLVLPRDERVVIGATAGDLLATLAGVELGADDFRAVLTGCIVPNPRPLGARIHENGWIAVSIDAETTAYLQVVDGVPVVIAGRRPGLTVWYSDHVRGLPRAGRHTGDKFRQRDDGPHGETLPGEHQRGAESRGIRRPDPR